MMTSKPLETLRFTVAFDEADGEGIVFFGNYFRLAHRALELYLPQRGITWHEWFAHPEWAIPLRHVEADYLGPLHPGDVFEADLTVERLGESSVTFAYEFRDTHGRPLAQLKTVHVFMSRGAAGRKMSVPETLRSRLAPNPL